MAKHRGNPEEWITSAEAARIISNNSGHEISAAYVRLLASDGKIETKQIDARTKLYLKSDAEKLVVKQRGKKET